ncbi:hypothetical protein NQ317_005586 [Molorchus minor]|uniref:SUN domain-containing protein n=1 Tax=Molorchus minor TaxID=1323400 RepID=A0ABQ9K675_9CUCU|nr:hypothetical protein NQ317_005586 [Molorchus minor]
MLDEARRQSSHIQTPLKDLYVNLSDSRVESPSDHLQIVAKIWTSPWRRRDSVSSNDSREFNVDSCVDKPLKGSSMFDPFMENPCVARPNQKWLKYAISICVTATFYVYAQLLHNQAVTEHLATQLFTFKQNFADTKRRLEVMVENTALRLKYQQEMLERNLQNIIAKEIEKFGSDKTGMTDFALESTGGKIIQLSPGTENFEQAVSMMGMTLCDGKHGPRAMIQVSDLAVFVQDRIEAADMSPGYCWAIKGSSGGVIIKLLGNVRITAVSVEHISKNLSPTKEVSSAPKNFSVWGLKSPTDRGVVLGEFSYDVNGALVQTYKVNNSMAFEYVEFRVLTNQGESRLHLHL